MTRQRLIPDSRRRTAVTGLAAPRWRSPPARPRQRQQPAAAPLPAQPPAKSRTASWHPPAAPPTGLRRPNWRECPCSVLRMPGWGLHAVTGPPTPPRPTVAASARPPRQAPWQSAPRSPSAGASAIRSPRRGPHRTAGRSARPAAPESPWATAAVAGQYDGRATAAPAGGVGRPAGSRPAAPCDRLPPSARTVRAR